MWRTRAMLAMFVAAAFVLAACGGGGGESATAGCGEGAQVVRIQALDTLRFDPASVTVKADEPVCFSVTNAGETDHEFRGRHEGDAGQARAGDGLRRGHER